MYSFFIEGDIVKTIFFKVISLLLYSYLLFFVPIIFGWKPLIIISGSMEPMYHVGGLLYYKEKNISDFKINDIVVFNNNVHIVSHRIVDIIDSNFITKGDANKRNDLNVVKSNQVLGVGTNWCIPFVGYYLDFIYNNKWFLVIIIIMFIFSFFWKRNEKE